jgi:hypothetical protein
MASLTANLQDKLNIATDLDDKVRNLGLPCPVDLGAGDLGGKGEVIKQSECLSSFEGRLAEVDHQIVRLSWSLDGAAMDGDAQVQLTGLKDGYWRSCKPEDDARVCGTRERMRRIIYGSVERRALFTCPRTRLNWNVDKDTAQACWNASQNLGKVVGEFEQQTNLFFCELLIDVNKRLIDLYRDKNMKALSNSLEKNQASTRCWKLVHDAAPPAPPTPQVPDQRP